MKTYKDLNEAFVESLKELHENHSLVKSRGSTQREILWYNMMIEDPSALSIEVPARKFKPSYAITEWLWYLSQDPNVQNIGKLASIWRNIANHKNEVESNYGLWIHGIINGKTGLNQWEWVRDELLRDRDTRRASITINSSHHKGQNNKDYPCTQYIHFFIRDNKLHLGVHMRSNDAVFGFCNDVFTFCMYQQMMLNELNTFIAANGDLESERIELGHYYHSADSFHVYESHFKMMDKIVENYGAKHSSAGVWAGKKQYPDLKKYKLVDTITLQTIKQGKIFLPKDNLSKEEINEITKSKMELLYV
jgi:thymidylate synthase